MSIESVMLSNHLILCCPLLLLPSIFPSIGVFSSDSALHIRWTTAASASALVLPVNIQDWFPLELTGLITLQSKGLSRVFSALEFESINSFTLSLLYGPALTSIHDYWKNYSFDYMDLCWQVMSLLFNILSRFVIVFLPRSKHLWLFCLLSLDIFTITQTHLAQTTKSLLTGWSLFLDWDLSPIVTPLFCIL